MTRLDGWIPTENLELFKTEIDELEPPGQSGTIAVDDNYDIDDEKFKKAHVHNYYFVAYLNSSTHTQYTYLRAFLHLTLRRTSSLEHTRALLTPTECRCTRRSLISDVNIIRLDLCCFSVVHVGESWFVHNRNLPIYLRRDVWGYRPWRSYLPNRCLFFL